VLSESSAFGNTGPWARRLGYGPLVRASAGLSALWRYPDIEGSFSDAITIFPDHVVARLNAAAVAALLLRRERTGRGGRVSTAQVDAIFGAMADLLALESLAPGRITVGHRETPDAPAGIYATTGDDEWLVVDGTGNQQFHALSAVVGHPEWVDDPRLADPGGRQQLRSTLDAAVATWAAARNAPEAAAALQAAGVPAANMVRITDFEADPHLRARHFFGELRQPQFAAPLPAMLNEARFQSLPAVLLEPAPLMAEHTSDIASDALGLDAETITALIEDGVLEIHPSRRPAAAR
jgi:crotonobetainyl-CoA:carnitine CoA-transferase CaiB-like acyl-CoA transferase